MVVWALCALCVHEGFLLMALSRISIIHLVR